MGPLAARRRGGPLALLAAGALAAGGAAACAGDGGGAGAPAVGGRPLGRAPHPRSGHLTWQLGAVERLGEARVRVDLRLHNGTHRHYGSLLLRVTVHGPDGETRSARLPLGGLRDGQSRSASARVGGVTFPVHDVTLDLVYAAP